MVAAHHDAQVHCGEAVMAGLMSERPYNIGLPERVSQLIRRCLYRKYVKIPRQIQCPDGSSVLDTQRNEEVHWDFIYLGDGYGHAIYALALKESQSHFCVFVISSSPKWISAAEMLTDWYKQY
ncbi:hypothetical protein F441_03807 [Phytophthora nicotianae CJ01A1]|uniref:Uncharacterized protein n=3 Tax=Phytophthora nicotianae TaxID=4792 RepID=W2QP14_PHYN3|nr:hypothetical protein PPTG_08657 [Phytophthora nicotianae INRA-310]ETN13995.1 hypothetical protein PPTG_08657 [Phytophthora nicotianae INRA-310]ETP22982.1 hypothetical protein F441_03807 [Phytophthora nicotianae CJ01A1]